jgi:hypothetical protein
MCVNYVRNFFIIEYANIRRNGTLYVECDTLLGIVFQVEI